MALRKFSESLKRLEISLLTKVSIRHEELDAKPNQGLYVKQEFFQVNFLFFRKIKHLISFGIIFTFC